jgi:hypothetical protein
MLSPVLFIIHTTCTGPGIKQIMMQFEKIITCFIIIWKFSFTAISGTGCGIATLPNARTTKRR